MESPELVGKSLVARKRVMIILKQWLEGADLVFISAGLGGGTGTGAAQL